MTERRTIEIYVVMDESGAFVVADDPDVAAERAEEELDEHADRRQVTLIIELQSKGAPITASFQID